MDAPKFITFQVKQLDLSTQSYRDHNYRFPLDAVCKILPQVTERLNLRDNRLKPMDISQLQDELHRIYPTVSTSLIVFVILFEYFVSFL